MRDLLGRRLRAHRLSAPARSVTDAAAHMLAVQAQDFAGGRWALGVRTAGSPRVSDVDRAFERGDLVRAWTQRGTLHILPARDLGWMLAVSAQRQMRLAAPRHRELGLDDDVLRHAETVVRTALRGGGRLTRAGFAEILAAAGIDPSGQRGVHVIQALALRGVVVWGPVVTRENGPAREQYLVLTEEWVNGSTAPADPVAEMFDRYVTGHGPASVRDFAWWSGLPLTAARRAAEGADAVLVGGTESEPVYESRGPSPRRSTRAARVLALPPFDEYYISYADRSATCSPTVAAAVGPGKNGMVRATLVADGRIVGVWTHSLAVGRHGDDPVPDLLVPGSASADDIAGALDRYRRFITG